MKLYLGLLSLLLVSCNGTKNNRPPAELSFTESLEENVEDKTLEEILVPSSTYLAVLNPVNPDTVGFVSGSVTVNIEVDNMATNIRFNGPSTNSRHIQVIHSGGFCPNEIADENLDGYIDVLESFPYTSGFMIPLDGDLNSQLSGYEFFPMSDNWGTYIFSTVSSYQSVLNDLYQVDENSNDELYKLIPNSPLSLDERVVMIYGIADTEILPPTVGTLPMGTPNELLPVACGVFEKIESIPGTIEPDDITIADIGSPRNPQPENRDHTIPRPDRPRDPSRPGVNRPVNRPNNGGSSPVCRRDKTCL